MFRQHFLSVALLVTSTTLAGCGGGGGGVNSASSVPVPGPASAPAPGTNPPPPPPQPPRTTTTTLTPLAPTNGLIAGTFDTTAIVEHNDGGSVTFLRAAPGQVRITIDPATMTYTVTTSVPGLLAEKAFDMGHVSHGLFSPDTQAEFGNHVVTKDSGGSIVAEYDATSGRSRDPNFQLTANQTHHYLQYDLGLRYVSLGIWTQSDWKQVGPSIFQQTGTPNKIYFVHGSRTPASAIPSTGSATYRLDAIILDGPTIGGSVTGEVLDSFAKISHSALTDVLTLTANFVAGSISADVNIPSSAMTLGDGETYFLFGVRASGLASFSASDDFSIPLTGDLVPHNGDIRPAAPVTGGVLGSFFGPNAENVGGLLQLTPEGDATLTVPFAAQRQ